MSDDKYTRSEMLLDLLDEPSIDDEQAMRRKALAYAAPLSDDPLTPNTLARSFYPADRARADLARLDDVAALRRVNRAGR